MLDTAIRAPGAPTEHPTGSAEARAERAAQRARVEAAQVERLPFDLSALETLKKSYVELKLLPTEPDMSTLYTEAFLPK